MTHTMSGKSGVNLTIPGNELCIPGHSGSGDDRVLEDGEAPPLLRRMLQSIRARMDIKLSDRQ